jgi:hypothetical protein
VEPEDGSSDPSDQSRELVMPDREQLLAAIRSASEVIRRANVKPNRAQRRAAAKARRRE